ncbi:MAG: response regulator transcription factor, partial [Bacilli bacterium]
MENKKLIYAVDDDSSIRELYSCALETDFICETFVNEEELFIALKKKKCDLILLDLMLEGKDGYDILNELKANGFYKDIPVIMVSAKGSEVNKVKGLNYGADDYISKPFGVMELVARINANLRKTHQIPALISFKDLEFNSELHEILLNKTKLILTLKEFNLLKY